MKVPEATAVSAATASSARRIRRNALTVGATFGVRDEQEQGQRGEEGAAGHLGGRVDRELTLEDARARPGKRCERRVGLAAAADTARVARNRGNRHRCSSTSRRRSQLPQW